MNQKRFGLNQKGVFITLTAFLLAGMLILSASALLKARTLEENAITLAIASGTEYSLKETLLEQVKKAYFTNGMDWNVTDNNILIYKETFPNTHDKNALSTNLSKLKAFLIQEFPSFGSYTPETADLGLIRILGKDMNIKHSATSGFGLNKELYFNYSSKKFNSIRFDINTDAGTLTKYDENITLCSSCTNPLTLIINVKNNGGTTIYTYNNIIDLSQNGKVDFNISPATPEISLTYNSTNILLNTNTTILTTKTTIIFNDPIIQVIPNQEAINITQMSTFGITG